MFAIEIEFSDGISLPEMIFVRRTTAILGTGETAHVLIETSQQAPDIRVTRGLGREFRTDGVRRPTDNGSLDLPVGVSGDFKGEGDIQFGGVRIRIVALDVDVILENEEAPDAGAIRILKNALMFPSPVFPAIAVLGGVPVLLSFSPRAPVTIGRSRSCLVRFDASGISSEHAKIGCEGGRCWVEDLGSTNGTFVAGAKIEGRKAIDVDNVISLGNEISLAIVYRSDDIARLQNKSASQSPQLYSSEESRQQKFPIIFSENEHVRPARFLLSGTGKLTVGRDPANDIWINTPHVSRCHFQFEWGDDGRMRMLDESSNGTYVDGQRMPRGNQEELSSNARHIDLGAGVELHIAHSAEEEREIREALQEGTFERITAAPLPPPRDAAITGMFDSALISTTLIPTKESLPAVDDEGFDEEENFGNGSFSPSFGNGATAAHEDLAPQEAQQFQLLDDADEPLGLGSNFPLIVFVLLIVLLLLFGGLVFLGFFADKYFY